MKRRLSIYNRASVYLAVRLVGRGPFCRPNSRLDPIGVLGEAIDSIFQSFGGPGLAGWARRRGDILDSPSS